MRLDEFLEASAAKWPDKVAVVAGSVRRTYRELWDRARALAAGLKAEAGVGRGDRVVILLESSVEAVESIYACARLGAPFIVLHPTTRYDKMRYVLEDSGARCLITDEKKRGRFTAEGPILADGTLVVVGAGHSHSGLSEPRGMDYEALCARYGDPDAADGVIGPRGHLSIDLAALIYTSGSTGDPKGVMVSHQNIDAASRSIVTYLENTESDVILDVLPLSFDYGLYQVLMSVRFGGTVVLERSFAFVHQVLTTIAREKVTGLPLVPTMAAVLLDLDLSAYDLSSLRYVTNTAAALPVENILRLRDALPHVSLYSMYGLTECKRVSYLPPAELDRRPASVGVAIPDTEVFVVDEHGARVPPGVVGELVVRGAHVMLGYWNKPEATAQRLRPGVLSNERWLYTGDLFKTDDEGFLYFVGRTDDIIKSRGEKVAPREIERVLEKHDGVKDAAVFGVPDPVLGARVCAVVTPRPGHELTPSLLMRHLKTHLEDILMPQVVEVRASMPLSASGKIDKRALAVELSAPETPREAVATVKECV